MQPMTSNQSDLSESMDAQTTGSSPPDRSVKFELDQTLVNHLGASVALSVMAGLALVLASFGTQPNLTAIAWTIGLTASHLLLWLTAPRYANPGTIAIITIVVFSLVWILAGPVFISNRSLVNGILSSTIIIIVSAICPMMYLQTPWVRRLTTVGIYGSITACLVTQIPSLATQAPVTLLVLYLLVDMANSNCRRALASHALKALRAMERCQHTLNTSHKITSLIEQTPLGFIEWNQNREIIGWNPAATAIFGFSRSEALGRTTDFLFQDKKLF